MTEPDAVFLNYQLPDPASMIKTSAADKVGIAHGIHAALEPGHGKIQIDTRDHLLIKFTVSDPPSAWMELAIHLDGKQWTKCHRISLKYSAACPDGTAEIRPAMRMLYAEGFHDQFAESHDICTEDPTDFATDFLLSPRFMADAVGLALHLFFDPQDTRFQLFNLSMTGIK
ncbi:hypothetical protein [Pseudaestuariivita rosea]|uniref:hypothetical protein n=1 Tax=Pseudaestuariivita rosea TaxID=2763263 RepID=UPI001ABB0CC4|nr:hypothetical protein [Pseudaestuariivita rosea]